MIKLARSSVNPPLRLSHGSDSPTPSRDALAALLLDVGQSDESEEVTEDAA